MRTHGLQRTKIYRTVTTTLALAVADCSPTSDVPSNQHTTDAYDPLHAELDRTYANRLAGCEQPGNGGYDSEAACKACCTAKAQQ